MFSFCLHFIYEKSSFESKPVCFLKSKICHHKGTFHIQDHNQHSIQTRQQKVWSVLLRNTTPQYWRVSEKRLQTCRRRDPVQRIPFQLEKPNAQWWRYPTYRVFIHRLGRKAWTSSVCHYKRFVCSEDTQSEGLPETTGLSANLLLHERLGICKQHPPSAFKGNAGTVVPQEIRFREIVCYLTALAWWAKANKSAWDKTSQHSSFNIHRSSFNVHRSSFNIQHSTFILNP